MGDTQIKKVEQNQDFISLTEAAERSLKLAGAMKVLKEADLAPATNLLAEVKDYGKRVGTLRRFFVDPYNAYVKSINGRFKPLEEKVDEAELMLKKKLVAFNERQTVKLADKKEEVMAKIDSGEIGVEAGVKALEGIDGPQRTVRAEGGTVSFRTIRRAVVEDESLLPREYLVPDMQKITKVALAGVKIPGVKVTEEKSPSVRSNFR